MRSIVMVGTGQAGFQLAAELRQSGFDGRLCLVGDERDPPYQRPPLSKCYLLPEAGEETIRQRPSSFFAEQRIELIAPERAIRIDRKDARLQLASGETLSYDHLILATGARNRRLEIEGSDLAGIFYVRSAEDARCLRRRLDYCANVVVIGAGFIGLEFAAVAASRGARVTVVEQAGRVMARVTSPEMSAYFKQLHQGWGTQFLLNTSVARIVGRHGSVTAIETREGQTIPADLVLVGIGVVPNTELAESCGLPVGNGILVDAFLATEDTGISAIGDCACHPSVFAAGRIRLESVQNATDQARLLARRLLGLTTDPYASVPWFWSDQGPVKLQIAGLGSAGDDCVLRGDRSANAFSVFRFRGGRLAAVESVGRPGDHLACRQILARGLTLEPTHASDPAFDLKALLKTAPVAATQQQ